MNTSKKESLSNRKFLTATGKVASSKPTTKLRKLPAYLKFEEEDSLARIFPSGGIKNKLKDIHGKVSVTGNPRTIENARDPYFFVMRGARTNLTIEQDREQAYKPTDYFIPVDKSLARQFHRTNNGSNPVKVFQHIIQENGIKAGGTDPENPKEGQEVQSVRVAEKIFSYLEQGNMPPWELPDMMANHSTTTKALEIATQKIYLNTDHESL